MKPRTIALCSGGMDSVVALYHMAAITQVVKVVSFNYGSKHNHREIPMAVAHASLLGIDHVTVPLPFVGAEFKSSLLAEGGAIPDGHYADHVMKQTVVPFRNGIMLAIAAGLAESVEAEAVVIAAHAGDHAIYPDCRAVFMEAMREAIRVGTYAKIALVAPFQHATKAEIVTRGMELGVNFAQTWSCYKGGNLHCGRCGTCIERREAFHLAGVQDPTPYAADAPRLEELIEAGFKLP